MNVANPKTLSEIAGFKSENINIIEYVGDNKMYVLEADNNRRKWISGIFNNLQELEEYIEQIPEELKELQIKKTFLISYPFYIIEKQEAEFVYLSKYEFIEYLNQFEIRSEEDVVHFNFFYIQSDFQPIKPGTDYMGILTHGHVTNDFLVFFKKEGEEFLKRNRFSE